MFLEVAAEAAKLGVEMARENMTVNSSRRCKASMA